MDFSFLDNSALIGLVLCATLAWTSWQARRLGSERRDVRLLGATAAFSGLGAGLAAFF
jgi:hypothetical protein